MHIHILGICGTFMGSLAQLAKASGHRVSGCDTNVYPPMSTQLEQAGIELIEGYDPVQLDPAPDLVVVGNALSRGNPCVEYMLNKGLPYTSGPQWLGEQFLNDKWVLAVAGTHGKTTTASMLAWILEYADMAPGFLIGGVPKNFGVSARMGETPFFVVEADEYDTAFFDKRSKFVHYRPRTLVLNNLEFDHADIFADLAAIQTQFHHLVRTVPAEGLIIYPRADNNLAAVIDQGCWTPLATTGKDGQWLANLQVKDGSQFDVLLDGEKAGEVAWDQSGDHSVANALVAVAAARHVGVATDIACRALSEFAGVKRRMECLGEVGGVRVYDDFAHHPTAIATTLQGLRKKVGTEKIIAVIEPRSNTMKLGIHKQNLATATDDADQVLWFQPSELDWSLSDIVASGRASAQVIDNIDELITSTLAATKTD
ncbi:MAG: UDP-N-acetylmuramate:L-alanyl-gamma-D-glutamyl-meso-diaminopimelate ligase, partial [Gammaproteobacteria bacterium]